MRGGSVSFTASADGKPVRVVSRSGRGRGRVWNRSENARLARVYAPDARAVFDALLPVLMHSRPLLVEEQVTEVEEELLRRRAIQKHPRVVDLVPIVRTVRHVKPAVYGVPAFRNVIEDGQHR